MKLEEVKKKYEKELLKKANVVGVMTSYKIKNEEKIDKLSIVCLVERKFPENELKKKDIMPKRIMGVPTDVIEVGEVRALQIDKKSKLRPCPMGTSGGHYKITAGTNGELLKDRKTGKKYIGTNNHVGANSNDAGIGDAYLQPGPYDGGKVPDDIIGKLLRFIPIKFIGDISLCPAGKAWSWLYNATARIFGVRTRLKSVVEYPEPNLVDAAIIEVINDADISAEIVDIGVPKGVKRAQIDMLVQKSGRTTCHTANGPITGVDATINVSYGIGKTATFRDQIVISKPGFSAGGDSGSLVLDMDGYGVGKLFAGSDTHTIANHLQTYLDLLDAELLTE